jgi:large-conductance mechanosensitive channel
VRRAKPQRIFVNAVIIFLVVAIALFLLLRQINKLTTPKEAPAPVAAPEDVLTILGDTGFAEISLKAACG